MSRSASATASRAASARSAGLNGLPTGVTGSVSSTVTALGAAACSGTWSEAQARSSSGVAWAPGARVTNATGTSPACTSGRPTACAAATAGCASSTFSMTAGSML